MTVQVPKFEVYRTQKNGKPAIELVVRNALYSPALAALTDKLGYEATPDIANRRSIVCTSAAEIDAARDPLQQFFDDKGNYHDHQ